MQGSLRPAGRSLKRGRNDAEGQYTAYTYTAYTVTKMVQLSDDAYARLKALKRRDESFSDVVLRLAPKGDLRDLWKIGRTKQEIDEAEAWIRSVDEIDRAE